MTQSTPPAQSNWVADIRRLEDQVVQLKVSLEAFMAKTMGRSEIEAEILSRVAQDTYQSDMKGLSDRLMRIESGPQRMLGWFGAATGCLGVMVGAFSVVATIIFWLVANFRH